MILLAHMLLGALIGQKIGSAIVAIILALLSHYFLDFFPHIEYDIDKIKLKEWKNAKSQILNVLLDFFSGLLLILLFFNKTIIVFICALIAVIPDCLSALELFWQNEDLKKHNYFHQERIHFLKYKKISNAWRISTQILVVIISLWLFRF